MSEYIKKWSQVKYAALNPLTPPRPIYGTSNISFLNPFYAAHAEAVFDCLHEGVTLLDYGCGDGKFLNWISRRLKRFTYYGIDPWAQAIAWANQDYQREGVKFGLTGSEVEVEAFEKADCLVSLSFFCHTTFDYFKEIVKRFTKPMGVSIFLEEKAYFQSPKHFGLEGFYGCSVFSEKDFDELKEEEGLKVTEIDKLFQDRNHYVLRIERNVVEELSPLDHV